ncbi:isoleucine--tRNA ligase, mitochondrial-like isoform X2 [Ptychodera flava]|uniref:isoleucine--tRNA ligase, mitochondrial-like isoform X2 n=1 Tax=Ptychodera flava TaxID=63121 RepID=UPI00396A11F9
MGSNGRLGYVYRDLKPVNWSPSSRTALAEAELEYNPKHISPSLYVKFPVHVMSEHLQSAVGNNTPVYCVIWTTTPWTLPANEAICYMPNKDYCIVKNADKQEHYLLAADRVQEISQVLGLKLEIKYTLSGDFLQGTVCRHPFVSDKMSPLLPANHVKMTVGTGLVHTAPAHGAEDYVVGVENNLSLQCMVDEDGLYTEDVGSDLKFKNVLTEANDIVIALLRAAGNLAYVGDYEHSYPYDWRTKKPIIIRASTQWFVNTAALKEKALECIAELPMLPKHANHSMSAQLSGRAYWCISRQRVWGVPLPVFYDKHTKEPLITKETTDHVVSLIQQHGSDCWWKLPMNELLPQSVLAKCGIDSGKEFTRGDDILDIWFDSGSSWAHVLKDVGGQADVYWEGEDQYGAWFQTSLLTSVAIHGRAPYRNIYVHGFTLDGEGRKMSKSLGNVIDPDVIINGGKNKKTEPAYGADVLRWKIAESNVLGRIYISPENFTMANQHILKIRNTLRYCLGNLSDFNAEVDALPLESLRSIDRYILHLLHEYDKQVSKAYDSIDFSKVPTLTMNLVHGQTSMYLDTVKDRLYSEAADSVDRRSSQTVLHFILESLTRSLAPIVPHLAEETALHQHQGYTSVFKTGWFSCPSSWCQPELVKDIDMLLEVRESFLSAIDQGKSREYDVTISTQSDELLQTLKKLQPEDSSCQSELAEILMASFTTVTDEVLEKPNQDTRLIHGNCRSGGSSDSPLPFTVLVTPASHHKCERCWKFTSENPKVPCIRCMEVLSVGWES